MISHCLKNVFGLKTLRYFTRVATAMSALLAWTEHFWHWKLLPHRF